MERRQAIKNIGFSFGSMTMSTGLISIIQSCQSTNLVSDLKFFNEKQITFLDRIFEIIIPETDTPGAKSLNISKFVDRYISKNIRNADQKYLIAMMDEFINMILTHQNINSIDQVDNNIIEYHFSNHIDNGSMIAMDGKNYSKICSLFRDMAVRSYMISEYVLVNKLDYVSIPGYYDGNVDV
jgi:hypothetical protein